MRTSHLGDEDESRFPVPGSTSGATTTAPRAARSASAFVGRGEGHPKRATSTARCTWVGGRSARVARGRGGRRGGGWHRRPATAARGGLGAPRTPPPSRTATRVAFFIYFVFLSRARWDWCHLGTERAGFFATWRLASACVPLPVKAEEETASGTETAPQRVRLPGAFTFFPRAPSFGASPSPPHLAAPGVEGRGGCKLIWNRNFFDEQVSQARSAEGKE